MARLYFFPNELMFLVLLFLPVPPKIVKQPQNISIDEGDMIILECEALGFPVPQITWFLNDSVLSTNSSLVEIISASKSEHEGRYRCEAKNPAGSVAASAIVTINKGLRQSEICSCLLCFGTKMNNKLWRFLRFYHFYF